MRWNNGRGPSKARRQGLPVPITGLPPHGTRGQEGQASDRLVPDTGLTPMTTDGATSSMSGFRLSIAWIVLAAVLPSPSPCAEETGALRIVAFGDSTTAPRKTIEKVYAGHCTGLESYRVLKEVVGERLEYLPTGLIVTL